MLPLLDQTDDTLTQWLIDSGQPAYRLRQIRRWLVGRADSFGAMTDLPHGLRESLEAHFQLFAGEIQREQRAEDGTEKLLIEWADGKQIEAVLLRDGARRTICISTQVGCAMGCVFCASGLSGIDRNLTRGEIIEQMLRLQQRLPDDERLSHIVVMGMGEPLANLDALMPALDFASHPRGLGISARRITISTVGLPAAMRRLTARHARYHLAVSLHAPNDELRNRLVPVNRNIGLQDILAAADEYFAESGRRLTFEYVLLADLNDQPEHARQLAQLLRGRPALLNVIPYNPVDGLAYRTPTAAAARQFQDVLESAGINVQVRQRKGDRIDAACGQLRLQVARQRG